MPFTHPELQKQYRDAYERDHAAKNRLAVQKSCKNTRDSVAKKEYERGLLL